MRSPLLSRPLARCVLAFSTLILLAGCQNLGGFGLGSSEKDGSSIVAAADPDGTADAATSVAEEKTGVPSDKPVDIRRYLGPDYCPELRIREGTESYPTYEAGHEGEASSVIWQGSVGKTARECLYDGQGNMTIHVGVSGRVVTGPKGGPSSVTLPLRISLIKYKENVISSDLYPLAVTIPADGSAVFSEVHEIAAPAPGKNRDYILYVGLDEKGEGLLEGKPVIRFPPKPKKEEVEEIVEAPPPKRVKRPPPKPRQQGNVLPTPSEGFVLGN